jgi:hypothetical protein
MQTESTRERAEELAERILPERTPKRRMLVIVNPYATTVSDRLKNLVVYALQSRYTVEAEPTRAPRAVSRVAPSSPIRSLGLAPTTPWLPLSLHARSPGPAR